MSITTAMCNSFKQELLGGTHDLDSHTIKLALKIYSVSSSISKPFNEVSSNNTSPTAALAIS